MTVEIERKWVLDSVPDAVPLGPGESLRQGYLAEGAVSVRVRITPRVATLTVKAGAGLERTEVELPLSAAQADALWPHTAPRHIVKTRHLVPLEGAGLVAEVDVYAGALAGLCTVEVEFPTAEAAAGFDAPAWFGREVTGTPAWTNAALARDGRPPS